MAVTSEDIKISATYALVFGIASLILRQWHKKIETEDISRKR